MLSLNHIEETVENMLADRFGRLFSFPVSELTEAAIAALKPTSDADRKRVEKEVELVLAAQDGFFYSEGKVYPKQEFFRGTEFKIIPTAFEIEKAVLLPGAAFIPFCNSDEVFADEFVLKAGNSKKRKTVTINTRFSEIAPAYMMLGNSGVIDYLSAECEENRLTLFGARDLMMANVKLTAFDMGSFYRDNQFNDGDSILVTVEDWEKCVFSLAVCREQSSDADKQQFVRDFERALLKVCEQDRDYIEIPQQIAEAYLFAYENDTDLRKRPVLTLEEYRLRMNEIAIKRDGSEWLLVPVDDLDTPGQFEQSLIRNRAEQDAKCSCGHDHDHGGCDCGHHHHEKDENADKRTLDPDLDPDNFSISTGTLESIDAILAELNAPINSVELGAMIYDAMSNGEEQFEGFRSRLMDFMELKFADDAQEVAFINFLEENWEIASEYFSPAEDAKLSPLRTRLLDLTKARIEYSVSLLERLNGQPVPEKTAKRLAAIHRDILDTLSLLNSDSRLEGDEQYEQLELRIGDIEDAWDDFMAQ